MTSEHIHQWEYFANAPRCRICEQSIGEAFHEAEQQLAQAKDIIRRLYGSFRWKTNTDQQETACKDAEAFLALPPDKRREW